MHLHHRLFRTPLALLCAALLSLPALASAQDAPKPKKGQAYEVHNIDVGQGSATLIRTIDGKNILVDTGWDHAGDRLVAYMKKIGVKKLDGLVITHRHMDHVGAVKFIGDNFPVKQVITPWKASAVPESAMVHLAHLRKDIKKGKTPSNRPAMGTAITGKDFKFGKFLTLETLWPPKTASGKRIPDYNDESVTMRVSHKSKAKKGADATFLVGGDLTVTQERWLARKMPKKLKVDWMVGNHHGSKGSSQREYMVAASGGYSSMLNALIRGKGEADPETLRVATKLKELTKGSWAGSILSQLDPINPNKGKRNPPKWLKKLVSDVKKINSANGNRYVVYSTGPNAYGHPNAPRMAEAQLAGFQPITTWASGSVVLSRTMDAKGNWAGEWKPKGVRPKNMPKIKMPSWLGKTDPQKPFNDVRREANTHWQMNKPHPEVSWSAPYDTSQNWRTVARRINKGRVAYVEEYHQAVSDSKKGTWLGKKPKNKAEAAKNIAKAKRLIKKLQGKAQKPWHGTNAETMVELTKDELRAKIGARKKVAKKPAKKKATKKKTATARKKATTTKKATTARKKTATAPKKAGAKKKKATARKAAPKARPKAPKARPKAPVRTK